MTQLSLAFLKMKYIFTLLFFGITATSVIAQEETNPVISEPVTIRLVCYSRAGEFPISYAIRYRDQEKFVSYKRLKKNKNNIFDTFSLEVIEKVSVVKGDEAIKKYGKNAGTGVIILDLKDQADPNTWRKIKRYKPIEIH